MIDMKVRSSQFAVRSRRLWQILTANRELRSANFLFGLFGIVFLIAFISLGFRALYGLGLHGMIKDEPHGSRAALASDVSTDGYIRELLVQEGVPASDVTKPAAAIEAALAELPPEGSILFIAPRNLPTHELMFLVVKTLSLPRSIYLLWCDGPNPPPLPVQEKIVAVMLYLVTPPLSMKGSKMVIPRLTIAPVSEAVAWTSYCSR